MKSFHFDFGNSSSGVIGMCARVLAENEEEAVKILRDKIADIGMHGTSLCDDEDNDEEDNAEPHIEYLEVYLNYHNVSAKQIDEVNDPETGEFAVEELEESHRTPD